MLPPAPSKPPRIPQISTLFKDHSFCFAGSRATKGSFDFLGLSRKIRAHGGRIVNPPVFTPGTTVFLCTDIKEEARLEKLFGLSTLVKLTVVSLEYVDQQLELMQRAIDSRARNASRDAPPPPPASLPQPAQPSSSSSSRKRPRSPSPSNRAQEDHPGSSRSPELEVVSSHSHSHVAPPPPQPRASTSTGVTILNPTRLKKLPRSVQNLAQSIASAFAASSSSSSSTHTFASSSRPSPSQISSDLNLISSTPASSSSRPSPSQIASALNLFSSSPASSSSAPRILLPSHPSLKGERAAYFNPELPSSYFTAGVVLEEPSAKRDARGVVKDPVGQWGFPREMVEKFPALRKRNFFVIQWHQATALHFDLRLQCAYSATNESDDNFIRLPKGQPLNPGTISFAIPKGVHGMSLDDGRYAAQTNLHPISYTTYEGGDGRRLSSDALCGTLLWDIGTYTVVSKNADPDSDDESDDDESSDHQERLLMDGMMKRSFEITLHGHHKLKSLTLQFCRTGVKADSRGRLKPEWIFKRTDRGGKAVEINAGGSDCATGGRSCLTGRTLKEVCEARVERWAPWLEELGMPLEEE